MRADQQHHPEHDAQEAATVLQHLQLLYALFLASPNVMLHYPIFTLTPPSPTSPSPPAQMSSSIRQFEPRLAPPLPPSSGAPSGGSVVPSAPSRPSRPSTPTSPRLHQRRRLAPMLPAILPLPPIPPTLVNSPYLAADSPFTRSDRPKPMAEEEALERDVLGLGDTVPMASPALSGSSSSPPTTPDHRPSSRRASTVGLTKSPSGVWYTRSPLGTDSPGALVSEAMTEYFVAKVVAERAEGRGRKDGVRKVEGPEPEQ